MVIVTGVKPRTEGRTETFKYQGEQAFKIGKTNYVFPHTYVLLPTASFEDIDWVSGDQRARRLGGLEIIELEGVGAARDWLFIKAKVTMSDVSPRSDNTILPIQITSLPWV